MEVRTYGDWQKRIATELTDEGKLLIGWLSGESDEMTPELAALLRQEFAWHAQARDQLEAHINKATERIADLQATPIEAMEMPSGPTEQYAKGFSAGCFQTYNICQQIIRSAVLEAMEESKRT